MEEQERGEETEMETKRGRIGQPRLGRERKRKRARNYKSNHG